MEGVCYPGVLEVSLEPSPETDRRKSILLVDDEPTLRSLIADVLSQDHKVVVAASGEEALSRMEEVSFDLIITDINMPDMLGPELIAAARKRNPKIRSALITAYSMEACVAFCLEHGVGNIIAKTIPFDFEELNRVVTGLLTEEVFDLERYLIPGTKLEEFRVRYSWDLLRVREKVLNQDPIRTWPKQRRLVLQLALDESISNAVYHSNRIPKGAQFSLKRYQQVLVYYGDDGEKVGISVVDQAGRLTKETILQRLDQCMNKAEIYFFQASGRGLYIIRSMVDRLIINIKRNYRTEIIMLFHRQRREIGHRPIFINDLS